MPLTAADAGMEQWLAAVAADECTQDEFVAEIRRRESSDPDAGWEALALLDRHFRRKLISHEVFVCLKARLQQQSLRAARTAPAEQPLATSRNDLPALSESAPPAPLAEVPLHREIKPGDMLRGRYRVVEILRRNGTGTLVEAIDEPKTELPGIRQRVAIHIFGESQSRDPGLLQRIGQLQGLSHAGIARILDVEEDGGAVLLIMELTGGAPLQDLLARHAGQRIPTSFAQAVVGAVANALLYAHSRGVVHGDLSTASVLLTPLGDTRLHGFRLGGAATATNAAADRLAFAWLAHELLVAPAANGTPRRTDALPWLAPHGVSRRQWRAMRDTINGAKMTGRETVIEAFADGRSKPLTLLPPASQNAARPARRSRSGEWLAAGIVAAVLGTGGYLYLVASADARAEARDPAGTGTQAFVPTLVDPAAQMLPAPPMAATPAEDNMLPPASFSAEESQIPPARPTPVARPRIELVADSAWVETTQPAVSLQVTRSGSVNSDVTFQWWTDAGSAQSGRDFRGIAVRSEVIPAGTRSIELQVSLIPDPERREPRTFHVRIGGTGPGATLGSRTAMQIAIVPPGYPAAR